MSRIQKGGSRYFSSILVAMAATASCPRRIPAHGRASATRSTGVRARRSESPALRSRGTREFVCNRRLAANGRSLATLGLRGIPGMDKHRLKEPHRVLEAARSDDGFDIFRRKHGHVALIGLA